MKKLLLSVFVAGLMSTGLMADDGTIQSIKAKADGTITVDLLLDNQGVKSKILVGSPSALQAMTAIVLTAKSSNSPVTLFKGDFESTSGWAVVIIK